ncbi:MAG: HEAT repeat domain-containing protein [Streptosporangiaceae bacterium]
MTTILRAVEELLRDPDPAVRRAAVAALARDTPRGAGDALAWVLADEDSAVRQAAAQALLEIDALFVGEDGIDALHLAAAKGVDERVRSSAARLLVTLTEGNREAYATALADDEPHIRVQAVLGLIALRAATAVGEAADDPDRDVRVAVADGLSRLEGAESALGQLLTDHDAVVRIAALDAAAVALRLPTALVSRVVVSLTHPGWQVRKHAATALAAAAPAEAIGPLIQALTDPTVDVRRAAIGSLEQWAAHSSEVLAALIEALADPDPGVRTQVRWALA